VSDLQTTYYIIGIVFMSLMLLLGLIGIIALLVIRAKITAIHRRVEERLEVVTDWADKSGAVLDVMKKVTRSQKNK